jgi:hypothetical protein
MFYVENAARREAILVCDRCSVASDCLDDALNTPRDNDMGIRGGTTPSKRNRLRKERQRLQRQLAEAVNPPEPLSAYVAVSLRWDDTSERYLKVNA